MARVVIHGEDLAAYLRSPQGDVFRLLFRLGSRLKTLAQAQVGYDTTKAAGRPDPSGGPNQPGGDQHLRDTIVVRVRQEASGIVIEVGSEHWLALMHHEGTRPHEIRPRTASILVFEMDGQTIFATVVHHPGTKPNRFLTDPLRELGIAV